ncbi:autotransporter outer membrane beta-barrel domain-containing protein [Escherichia coli]|uniref:autotransporter outer membrane beta-barrel domain-containing protein n=7 Tax=Escherichia coli TaxID=562 RepID=UPI001CF36655|nr:autotransporter outer membrane beta-barrel domain-containing protein [Escherichia coli]MCA8711578.1 autotransporter outer membrane beta-barrel domain-containing protein [Escherichia coli]UWS51491.1 autotransporter outer membrane beta-barrel domain-containing protein [Escherichia coli]UWY50559.1 autotransporter outer membrane beta-barrel domain-containing protein [Escherichia coli]UWY59174.1 autotransporter outer membrane beta-barrel domain-containing protein [Escherichia coli]UZN67482.1 aut
MNRTYNIVWNQSLMMWTVVSELSRGRKKGSSPKAISKPMRNLYLAASLIFSITGNSYAFNINGYTDFNTSTSISDGLIWATTATVQVDAGATVTVSNPSGSSTLNMASAIDSDTSLWINGGTLNATNSGSLLMGNNSMLQIGGAQLGGLSSEQSGGSAGNLSVGELKTTPGAANATIWMFGSSNSTAKLNADSIDLEADHNTFWIGKPSKSERGADITVKNDMTVINNKSGGNFLLVDTSLNVGGNLYLDTTNGSFLVTGNERSNGINVGGDFTLTNNVKLSDINAVSTSSGIYSTVVNVNGDLNVIGKNTGSTGLQIINNTGSGITSLGDFNISSTVSGNTTDVIFGHAAKVKSDKDITLNSVSGGAVNLYIGDSKYGAPTDISANSITMTGPGKNTVIFNNTNPTTPGVKGYVFNVPINGEGSVKQQSGHTTLASASDYNGGTLISGGLLSIANSSAVGSGNVVINTSHNDSNAGFDIAYTDGSNFSNTISGNGSTTVTGNAKITGDNASYTGNWNITGKATTDEATSTTQSNFGSGIINIDKSGLLVAKTTGQFSIINALTGSGTLLADNNGAEFQFTSGAGNAFSGDVILNNNTFALENINTNALTVATLHIGQGNTTTVGSGTQNIGGLAFDGGTLVFGDVKPGDTLSDAYIETAKDLNLTGKGQIQITNGGAFENTPQHPDTTRPLLQQDEDGILVKLAGSQGTVTGSGGNLDLIDQNGDVISAPVTSNITQNGEVVANGIYDYRLISGANGDGIYINYGLKEVDLLGQGNSALTLNAEGQTGNSADLSVKVTGTGDLAFDSAKGQTVTLSNLDNDYTGITDVRSGNLAMLNDNVLGDTSELKLANDTGFDMRGHSQTIGELTAESGSLTYLNGGHLTLLNGGESSGTLAGEGELTVAGGTLNIQGANGGLSATTTIAQDAAVVLNDTLGLGTGDIITTGLLTLSNAAGVLYNNISDTGRVALDASDVVLAGNNELFSGVFDISEGSSLTASAVQQLGTADIKDAGNLILSTNENWVLDNTVTGSGDVTKNGAGTVTLGDGAQWTGTTNINAGSLILGNAEAPLMLASSQVNIAKDGILTGFGGVTGNVTNSGTLDLRADAPGNVLTVGGNYTGNNGTLLMNTVLGDDSAATDKLVIKGDASGQTRVAVTNAGGTGAQTLNGIELIHVDGNADSAEFVQARRIAAGAYDYTLGRGQGSNSGNWYLTSGKNTPDPDSKPEAVPGGYDNDLRPEAGSYTANMAAANTMFVTRLHERLGPVQYTDVMTGETKNTSMWMRHEGGHNRWRDGTGQLKTQGNRYVVQLGGDIAQWGWGETDRWHLGVMAGYGNDHNNTDSVRTGYRSKGSVNGYSTGLYATWFANDETHNGAYLDTWAQYGWFDNHVKGDGLPGESWKSKGLTASLETGYTWKAGEFSGSHGSLNEWYVQPQAQVVWMGVKADEHRESNGTRVESTGDGNVRTRLGVKTWIKGHNRMDDGKSREFRPFVEVNWLHNTREFGTRMNGGTVHQDGARNIGEVKAGVEGQINNRLNLWGNVGVQAGDKGYSDTSAMLGVKYTF